MYCRVKPTRDGFGNFTAYINFTVPIYDIWEQFVVFYKYRVFQRFMIEFDENVCEFNDYKGKYTIFIGALLKSINQFAPGLIHKCPYHGIVGAWGLNIDKILNDVLPQTVPTGTYKALFRFHKLDNTTIAAFEIILSVDAVDVMKRMDMG